jgi:hypothetical protein
VDLYDIDPTQEEWDFVVAEKKIQAIKCVRARTGLGLKSAKAVVDSWHEDFINRPRVGWAVVGGVEQRTMVGLEVFESLEEAYEYARSLPQFRNARVVELRKGPPIPLPEGQEWDKFVKKLES